MESVLFPVSQPRHPPLSGFPHSGELTDYNACARAAGRQGSVQLSCLETRAAAEAQGAKMSSSLFHSFQGHEGPLRPSALTPVEHGPETGPRESLEQSFQRNSQSGFKNCQRWRLHHNHWEIAPVVNYPPCQTLTPYFLSECG